MQKIINKIAIGNAPTEDVLWINPETNKLKYNHNNEWVEPNTLVYKTINGESIIGEGNIKTELKTKSVISSDLNILEPNCLYVGNTAFGYILPNEMEKTSRIEIVTSTLPVFLNKTMVWKEPMPTESGSYKYTIMKHNIASGTTAEELRKSADKYYISWEKLDPSINNTDTLSLEVGVIYYKADKKLNISQWKINGNIVDDSIVHEYDSVTKEGKIKTNLTSSFSLMMWNEIGEPVVVDSLRLPKNVYSLTIQTDFTANILSAPYTSLNTEHPYGNYINFQVRILYIREFDVTLITERSYISTLIYGSKIGYESIFNLFNSNIVIFLAPGVVEINNAVLPNDRTSAIYVKESALNNYKQSDTWKNVADIIKPINNNILDTFVERM